MGCMMDEFLFQPLRRVDVFQISKLTGVDPIKLVEGNAAIVDGKEMSQLLCKSGRVA